MHLLTKGWEYSSDTFKTTVINNNHLEKLVKKKIYNNTYHKFEN